MSKLLKLFGVSVLAFLLSVHELSATHIRASEIRVRRISTISLTYEVKVIAYRDTGSDIKFGGGVLFIGGQELQDFDVTEIDLGDEISYNEFTVEFTFQGPGVQTIGYREENRNEGILNMFNSVETPFYVETQIIIDPIFGLNDSPVMTVPPVDRGAVGARFIHNPGAVDANGDSLSYRLTIPRQASDSSVVDYVDPNDPKFYNNFPRGNSLSNGAPTFSIDAITGDLVWDAPGQEGEYNVAFVIEEWRLFAGEWRNLGFVVRDMQIIIEDSDNEPPEIIPPPDLCVVAGTRIEEIIEAIDPDGHDIELEAFGGPFEVTTSKALFSPNPPIAMTTPAFMTFEWQTNCSHIRQRPYSVVIKATDVPPQNFGPSLVDFKTWQIQIVAPPPTGLITTVLPGEAIQLDWDSYECNNGTNMQVWRRVDNFDISLDSCLTGMPANAGYELIDIIDIQNTSYIDNNFGEGLAPGAKYCYRLVAEFGPPTSGESFVSNEACSIMLADSPVITNVSVLQTDEVEGVINVRWLEPFEIDQSLFPPPYKYEILRSDGLINEGVNISLGQTSNTFFNDSGSSANPLNTQSRPYNYQVILLDVNNQAVDTSAIASTVRLEPTPLVSAIELTWDAEVPWSNNTQDFPSHFVFRNSPAAPDTFTQLGVVNVNLNGFIFLDDGTHDGVILDDEETYCYFVTTQGSYGNPAINAPLINNSQIACAQPNDEIAPCTPVSFVVDEAFGCEQFLINQVCEFSDFSNRLIWEVDEALECDDDIRSYNIYFSEDGVLPEQLVGNVVGTEFIHSDLSSYKGCYRISSVDRSGNESELSEMICNDNCPFYRLPNVFTPNNDGQNDVFHPFTTTDNNRENFERSLCPRFVQTVKLKVFDRNGNEVFDYDSTSDTENSVLINWTGQSKSGSELPSGVYYYVADVTFDVLDETNAEQQITGWVHMLR